jgi:hypothetical protein
LYFGPDFLKFTLSGDLKRPSDMRKLALITIILIVAMSLNAQGGMQQVITSAGGSKVAPGGSFYIGWTLGETLVSTWKSSDGSITLSGGEQAITVTAVETTPGWDVEVSIYPNPARSQLTIKFNVPANEIFLLYLYDAGGRLIFIDKIERSVDLRQVDMEGLPPGTYFLRLVDGLKSNTFRVVKL